MKNILVLVLVVSLSACKEKAKEFKQFSNSISYKYLKFGEPEVVDSEATLELKLIVFDQNGDDTLHYVNDYHYFVSPKPHPLDSVFRNFSLGDSVLLKVNRAVFNDYFKFYKVLQADTGTVLLSMSLINSYNQQKGEMAMQEAISKREVEEQVKLKRYVNSLVGKVDTLKGVYRQILIETDSTTIRFGSQVSIHYKGYFLDGYVFDNTYEKAITPSFTFGQEYQMIDGLQTALSGRKEGERVKIILPSRHAFGEEGSLAGIVPPYTAVIYDVNIIKVIN